MLDEEDKVKIRYTYIYIYIYITAINFLKLTVQKSTAINFKKNNSSEKDIRKMLRLLQFDDM